MTEDKTCRMLHCTQRGEPPGLRIEVWPPSDVEPVIVWMHSACFEAQRDPSVSPDLLAERGRIPSKARCAFCGRALPLLGSHPYALDIGDASPPERYWAHAECMKGAMAGLAPSHPGAA